MKRFKTLRVRFALWTAGLMLTVLCLFGGVVYLSMKQGLERSLDDSLRLSATQAIAAVNIENGQINFSDSLPDSQSLADLQERGLTIRVLSLDGAILASVGPYRSLPVEPLAIQKGNQGTPGLFSAQGSKGGDLVRIYSAPVVNQGNRLAILQVMQSTASVTQTLDRLMMILLMSIPLLLVLSALSGYFLAARALSPIDQIIRTAQQISAKDLSARLNLNQTNDEVGRLAITFDQMLSRLESAFLRERQFTADASHELRTPLAATQSIIHVVRQKRRKAEEYEKALDDIAEETERLRTMAENLLFIARGEAQDIDPIELVNLSELLIDVAESLKPLAESKGVEITWNVSNHLFITGDSDALIRMFLNLIDNAVKYTEHGSVHLQAAENGVGEIQITLQDTGRGIPEEHLPHIFERFYRVEASRTTRGSGLGLAIVQEIVAGHQGRIEVTSQVGKGTCFHMAFPLAARMDN